MTPSVSLRCAALSSLLLLTACGGAAPTATATAPEQVAVGALVRLDGTGSSVTDGGPLLYEWVLTQKPDGSEAHLANARFAVATLKPDVGGDYALTLTVQSASGQQDQATLTVTARTGPIAEAGDAQFVAPGTAVTLDGSGSTGSGNGTLGYRWSLAAIPTGSAAQLDDAASATPHFTADVAGTYRAELVVVEAGVESAPDAAFVVAGSGGQAPVVDAGMDRDAVTGQTEVVLDGSASVDPDGVPLTGSWTITSAPTGSRFAGMAFAGLRATFIPDVDGDYQATLSVFDGREEASASITLHAEGPCCLTSTLTPGAKVMSDTEVPFTVEVKTAAGLPVREIEVAFEVDSGDLTLGKATAITDANGQATVPLQPGTTLGAAAVSATCAACGTSGSVTQTLEIVGGPAVRFESTVGPDAQIPGPVLVTVKGLDANGNLASTNDHLTLEVTGAATWASTAGVGTLLNGGGSSLVEVELDAGQLELELSDATAETVDVIVVSAEGLPADLYEVALPTVVFPNGYQVVNTYTFQGAPPPSGDGEVEITALGDFGDPGEYLSIYLGTPSDVSLGAWGPYFSGQDCGPAEAHSVPVTMAELATANTAGELTISLVTSQNVDPGVCSSNEAAVTLRYSGSRSVTFLP